MCFLQAACGRPAARLGGGPRAAFDAYRGRVAAARAGVGPWRERTAGGAHAPRHHWRAFGLGDDGAGFFGFSHPAIRCRLEDLDGVAFLAALGVARSASAASVPAFAVATAANATDRPRLRWSDLADTLGRDLAAELRARAEDIGYRYA